MIKPFLLGIVSFAVFLAASFVVFRVFWPKERMRALTRIFVVCIPVYIILYIAFPTGYMILTPVGDRAFMPFLSMDLIYRLTGVFNFLSGLFLYAMLVFGYLLLTSSRALGVSRE